eukprot:2956393-Pleurochrysis_carterae.AAC.1
MSRQSLKLLCSMIKNGGHIHKGTAPALIHAMRSRDHPAVKFKVAACLYYMAHGAPSKVVADVASIG